MGNWTGATALGVKVSPEQTGAFTASFAYGIWLCGTGTYTVTLPPAADGKFNGVSGKLTFKHSGASGTVTIDGSGSETIDGATTLALTTKTRATIVSDGTAWHIISA